MAGCEESEGGEAELSVAPLRFSQGDPLRIALNASASPRAFAKCAEGNATGAYAGEVEEIEYVMELHYAARQLGGIGKLVGE